MTHDISFTINDLQNIVALIQKAPITGIEAPAVTELMHKATIQTQLLANPAPAVATEEAVQEPMEVPDDDSPSNGDVVTPEVPADSPEDSTE